MPPCFVWVLPLLWFYRNRIAPYKQSLCSFRKIIAKISKNAPPRNSFFNPNRGRVFSMGYIASLLRDGSILQLHRSSAKHHSLLLYFLIWYNEFCPDDRNARSGFSRNFWRGGLHLISFAKIACFGRLLNTQRVIYFLQFGLNPALGKGFLFG